MSAGSMKQVAGVAGQVLTVTMLALSLAACGGGGGSAGSTGLGTGGTTGGTGATGGTSSGGATGGPTTTIAVPTMTLALVNGSTPTTSISASGATSAQATVLDEKGQPVKGKLVTFTGDPALVTFTPASGAVLTDSSTGIAKIQVAPASLASAGAGAISATSTVVPSAGGTAVTTSASFDFQLSAANLTLSAINVASGTPLSAYGNRTVSVQANINGSAATSTPVQVNFTASCGTVTPATVTTDGTGYASSTYTANSTSVPGCAGANVTITAAATGASSVTGTVAVQPTQATNIQFVGANPQLIYLSGSVGATQSQVSFKVVDSSGTPLANQPLTLSLTNTGPGVSIGTLGNTAPQTLSSGSDGVVSVPVFSGSIPTSVQVSAVLVSNSSINTKSNILKVASGVPVQSAASIALGKFSIEGFYVDGATSSVTFSLADRQGNPVPVGTTVNFVSSSAVMRPATCTVPALPDGTSASACAVSIIAQGTRPANGRVVILAYTPGEEDFVDANFNNVYDAGETFTDLGNAYRDDNLSGDYTTGEFSVPRSGASTCSGGFAGRPDTCDGVWGAIDVRGVAVSVFSTGTAHLSNPLTSLGSGISAVLSDENPNTVPAFSNSLPTGTTIAVTTRSHTATGACSLVSATPGTIVNRVGPQTVKVVVKSDCVPGDFVDISATSPGGIVTTFTLTLTP